MEAKIVKKRVQLNHRDIIRYQLITRAFIDDISINDSEFRCLTLLGVYGECDLSYFCNAAVEEGIFKTTQSVRNLITKAEKEGLIIKKTKMGSTHKRVSLSPELGLETEGNIALDYKFVYIATQEQ